MSWLAIWMNFVSFLDKLNQSILERMYGNGMEVPMVSSKISESIKIRCNQYFWFFLLFYLSIHRQTWSKPRGSRDFVGRFLCPWRHHWSLLSMMHRNPFFWLSCTCQKWNVYLKIPFSSRIVFFWKGYRNTQYCQDWRNYCGYQSDWLCESSLLIGAIYLP